MSEMGSGAGALVLGLAVAATLLVAAGWTTAIADLRQDRAAPPPPPSPWAGPSPRSSSTRGPRARPTSTRPRSRS